jgi:hypothetical protein
MSNQQANVLLAQYLVHCAAYYLFGESIVSDFRFDRDAKELADRWHEVTHPDRKLVDIEALRSGGTGYYIRFSQRIQNAALYRIKKMHRHI